MFRMSGRMFGKNGRTFGMSGWMVRMSGQIIGMSGRMFRMSGRIGIGYRALYWSPKCAAITGVGVDMSPHCFMKCPNGSASYTASGSKV